MTDRTHPDSGRAPLSANAPAPWAHIKEPYTLAEIKAKIASHDYSAEMLLQHAMLLLDSAALSANAVEPVAWQGVHDQTDLYYTKPVQADVRPLYANPPTAQVEGWRPISTAPKDGTHIIAYRPSVPPHIEGMYWAAYEEGDIPGAWHWSCDGESPTNNPPTHWMPLPPPPTSVKV